VTADAQALVKALASNTNSAVKADLTAIQTDLKAVPGDIQAGTSAAKDLTTLTTDLGKLVKDLGHDVGGQVQRYLSHVPSRRALSGRRPGNRRGLIHRVAGRDPRSGP
jgi:hypothetical protein